ncbi:isochorismatase hydrolase, partial [mine drainage metagenome]
MPLTTLDPTSALIVVDLQKGIASFVAADAFDEVVRRSRQLADAFRRRGLPVV